MSFLSGNVSFKDLSEQCCSRAMFRWRCPDQFTKRIRGLWPEQKAISLVSWATGWLSPYFPLEFQHKGVLCPWRFSHSPKLAWKRENVYYLQHLGSLVHSEKTNSLLKQLWMLRCFLINPTNRGIKMFVEHEICVVSTQNLWFTVIASQKLDMSSWNTRTITPRNHVQRMSYNGLQGRNENVSLKSRKIKHSSIHLIYTLSFKTQKTMWMPYISCPSWLCSFQYMFFLYVNYLNNVNFYVPRTIILLIKCCPYILIIYN